MLFDRWMGATQLEATFARRVFPCYDEPHLKASFDVIIGHRHTLTALSNMPLKSTSSM
jgi:aminopeptidase N